MKIILNFSTIVIGGGIQASISFLEELILYKDYDFHIFLSNQVSQQINFKSNQSNFKFYNIYNSPSKIRTRFKVLKQLKTLERKLNLTLYLLCLARLTGSPILHTYVDLQMVGVITLNLLHSKSLICTINFEHFFN